MRKEEALLEKKDLSSCIRTKQTHRKEKALTYSTQAGGDPHEDKTGFGQSKRTILQATSTTAMPDILAQVIQAQLEMHKTVMKVVEARQTYRSLSLMSNRQW